MQIDYSKPAPADGVLTFPEVLTQPEAENAKTVVVLGGQEISLRNLGGNPEDSPG